MGYRGEEEGDGKTRGRKFLKKATSITSNPMRISR